MAAVERVASLGRVGGEAVLVRVVDEAEGLAAARLPLGRLLHLHLLRPQPDDGWGLGYGLRLGLGLGLGLG